MVSQSRRASKHQVGCRTENVLNGGVEIKNYSDITKVDDRAKGDKKSEANARDSWIKCISSDEFYASLAERYNSGSKLGQDISSDDSVALASSNGPSDNSSSTARINQLNRSDSNHKKHYNSIRHQIHEKLQRIYGDNKRSSNKQIQSKTSKQDKLMYEEESRDNININDNDSDSVQAQQKLKANCRHNGPRMTINESGQARAEISQVYDSLGSSSMIRQPINTSEPLYGSRTSRYQIPADEEENLLSNMSSIASSNPLEIEQRRKQLESLQYATATAAALLRATANTAAAIATSEKRIRNIGSSSRQVQNAKRFSSDLNDSSNWKTDNRFRSILPDVRRIPIYANPRGPIHPMHYDRICNPIYDSAVYIQPPQMNPVARNLPNPMMNLHSVQSSNVPLRPHLNMRLDRINSVRLQSAYRQVYQNQNLIPNLNGGLSRAISAAPKYTSNTQPMKLNQFLESGAHNDNNIYRDAIQLFKGLDFSQTLPTNPKFYAVPTQVPLHQKAIPLNLNNLAANRVAPIMEANKKTNSSFIERLCRIDLTLFWWLLLLLSFMLMAVLFYITHYVF